MLLLSLAECGEYLLILLPQVEAPFFRTINLILFWGTFLPPFIVYGVESKLSPKVKKKMGSHLESQRIE